jgi:hypothetical protein
MGDMNVKLGQEEGYRPTISKESLHSISNDNGKRLINFATSRNIVISSTYFPRKYIYKQTCVSLDGRTNNPIDHIAIDKEHQSWTKNIYSFRRADGDTDHYLLVASLTKKFSINWRVSKNKNKIVSKYGKNQRPNRNK